LGRSRLESVAATGAGQYGKIRIREFDRLPESRETHTLRLQNNESETRIIVDDHFHWQLVVHRRQELAHQHVEAAIAAKGDDLARAVERLDAVGLTPVDGVIYVARRSLKGSAKFLWSAIEVASDQNDRRVDVEG